MTTLTVGSGQPFTTISAAVSAAKPGDTINVQAGTYTNDFPAQINGLTIQGVGGIVYLVATTQPPNGKAILVVAGNTTLRNLDISGVTVPDGNGAAIRYEGGNLVIQNSVIHGNQDGILGAADPSGTITIDGSEFYGNGTSTGSTHNIYIGKIATFTLNNSYVHDANTGHEVKSRAADNYITNNRIEDGSSSASYQIDLPVGGNAIITGNTIQKSANSGNRVTIAYGEESDPNSQSPEKLPNAGTAVTISNNTFVSDQPGAYVIRDVANAPVTATGNSIYGYGQIDMAGHVSNSGFTTAGSRPTLDTSSHIDRSGGSGGTTTPAPAPDITAPTFLSITESASGVTNRTGQTISGTVSDSGSGVAKIEIYDFTSGRTVDLGAASLSNGTFSLVLANLSDGSHAFSAVATDKAGNASPSTSAGNALIVDTTAPGLTARETTSGVTTSTRNVISVTASDTGTGVARVEIYDTTGGRTVDLGAATLDGGTWNFTASNLALGSPAFSAVATDNAGNASAPVSAGAAETVVAVSTTPPASAPSSPSGPAVVPSIAAVAQANGAFRFTGTAAANSTVTLSDTVHGTTATTTTGGDGNWSVTAAAVNNGTVNNFTVTAARGGTTTSGAGSLTLSSTKSEILTGTDGKTDVFAFAPGSGRDYIINFETTRDVIDLVGSSFHSFEQLQPKFTGSGSTIFGIGGGNAIAIIGVDPSLLTAANFRFT